MRRYFVLTALVLSSIALTPQAVYAASLSLTPGTQNVTAGNIVTLRVSVGAGGTAINNAEAVLDFPTNLLQVVSVSKGSSVFSLWVEDPSYSNSGGTISFNGGLPNPGYTGSSGTVVSITFLTKKAGVASVTLRDGAVRANDGYGTNVLSSTNNAQITIADPVVTPVDQTPTPTTPNAPTPTPAPQVTDKLVIVSTTHPDQNAWYSNRNPILSWKLPVGTVAIQTLISPDSPQVPTVTYKPAIVQKELDTLTDGSWYFSLRSRVTATWGSMSTYRIQIDGTAPMLENIMADYDTGRRVLSVSNIKASDVTSGLSLYEFSIDGGATTTVQAKDLVSTSYALPYKGTTGNHRLLLVVSDMAGNKAFANASFTIVLPLGDQVVWTLFGVGITLFWFLLIVLLISLTSLFVALTALYRTFRERPARAVQVGKRDQTLHRALTLFKQDMEKHLKTLTSASATRALTEEESGIQENLAGNVDDLERFLKKEIKKFD